MNENGMLLEFQIEEKKDRYCFTIDDKQNRTEPKRYLIILNVKFSFFLFTLKAMEMLRKKIV